MSTARATSPVAGDARGALPISEVARLTHVSESTLRIWERRYGFPRSLRTDGAHRRYSRSDVEDILAVQGYRAQGLTLQRAIARVQEGRRPVTGSICGHLRGGGAQLEQLPSELAVDALMTAILDELALRGEPLVVVCTTRAAGRPTDRRRYARLAGACGLVVLIGQGRDPVHHPSLLHVPREPAGSLGCEQLLIAVGGSVCGALALRPGPPVPDERRPGPAWEMLWTLDPPLVRSALQQVLQVARAGGAGVPAEVEDAVALSTARMSAEFLAAVGARLLRGRAQPAAR